MATGFPAHQQPQYQHYHQQQPLPQQYGSGNAQFAQHPMPSMMSDVQPVAVPAAAMSYGSGGGMATQYR